ncbi:MULTISPECIES: MFS transporter [unclassified Ruegeria]|uniref:MFS transporter n=1 Tax=unclassified Ruegeria TaxID=2625375 RepID=UPI0014921457|nr:MULTISPECIES: MFS transporter [unclassified Ruegeria]NOD46434.1 MFS transporter [Ruegeria sp. HKCCD5849]NOD50266.1 MFS transporter [Ruegeria sp. HKCCD5851]NOD67101.1 MFS transporter [Ruegeria sp. HKCCD7303]
MIQIFQVLLLWLAGLGAATQFAKIAVPFPELVLLYPDHTETMGWLLSIISLIGALLGALSGAIVGRVGPLKLLIFGLCLGGAISMFQATWPGFYIMLASRFVEGLSHLAIVVAAPTLIAQITTGKARNIAMVLWSTFFGVAFALNAWIGLPLIAAFGLTTFFLLHGFLMLGVAGVILICRMRVQFASDTKPWQWTEVLNVHLRTYRSPFVSAPAVGWFFYTLTFVSLLAILPGRLSEEISAHVAGLMPLAGIVLSWIAVPVLLNVMPCVAVINLGFGLGIFSIAGAFLGLPLEIVCVLLFAVLGLVQGGSFAAVPILNQTAEAQALSYGAMAQMGNAGNLLGTPVLLAVLWRVDEAGMLLSVIGIYAIAILAHIALARQRAAQTRSA